MANELRVSISHGRPGTTIPFVFASSPIASIVMPAWQVKALRDLGFEVTDLDGTEAPARDTRPPSIDELVPAPQVPLLDEVVPAAESLDEVVPVHDAELPETEVAEYEALVERINGLKTLADAKLLMNEFGLTSETKTLKQLRQELLQWASGAE